MKLNETKGISFASPHYEGDMTRLQVSSQPRTVMASCSGNMISLPGVVSQSLHSHRLHRAISPKNTEEKTNMEASINGGSPNGWFIMENTMYKLGWWLGYPYFRKPPNNSEQLAPDCINGRISLEVLQQRSPWLGNWHLSGSPSITSRIAVDAAAALNSRSAKVPVCSWLATVWDVWSSLYEW